MKALLTLAVLAVLTYSDSLVKKNTALKLSFRKHKPRRRCTHPNLRFWMDEWENQKVGLERTEMMCGLRLRDSAKRFWYLQAQREAAHRDQTLTLTITPKRRTD